MDRFIVKLSRFLAYLLRHHPEKFNLSIDDKGFADLDKVLNILNNRFKTQKIEKEDIEKMISRSDKKRFEIIRDKIRAYYGHSLSRKIDMKEEKSPPEKLFHGTSPKFYEKIKIEGLRKKARQYVHLSKDVETAIGVGKRRTKKPIILIINTKSAIKNGIKFYKSGNIYLADNIPKQYISLLQANNIES
ncbi:MAG: RNA 2'-phosphotransferase [Candidatus Lokiarchaeota archaeon]|nr:RNA 2'-phosphotransferase [Candidatus Lokiarchaeota archaeon]MBD3342953.1 RNA 2'-phosphotransferase [Candidatus Lokiarchaeota archaeon]